MIVEERHDWWRFDKRVKAFYEKYERWFVPGLLISGFAVDVITFRALDIQTTLLILGIHAALAGFAILYGQLYDSRVETPGKFWRYIRMFAALVAQFSLGSLLSSSLVFYWFSGAFSVSWPLVAIIVGLMVSSEFLRQFYLKPIVQLSLYTFVLYSYFTLLFPFVFHSLRPWTYILGGLASTVIVVLIVIALSHMAESIRHQRAGIITGVISVFVIMNILYFLAIIPPIPLSIREAGIYHNIIRGEGGYELVGEEENFFQRLWPGQTIHAKTGDTLYAYTAIFAPTDVTTLVVHDWQYYDEGQKKWVSKSRSQFGIKGGRQEGFRGYTLTSQITPGKWRVSVENIRGQVLGRVTFTVVEPE